MLAVHDLQLIYTQFLSVSLSFGPYEYDYLHVVGGIQNDEIILGRDLLNQFIVTLNGLATVVEIEQ
jgi:hypothetical protein